jgi:rubrerythrin
MSAEELTMTAAREQRERDLKNASNERGTCVGCGTVVNTSIDGRCPKCYELRFTSIFGFPPSLVK